MDLRTTFNTDEYNYDIARLMALSLLKLTTKARYSLFLIISILQV